MSTDKMYYLWETVQKDRGIDIEFVKKEVMGLRRFGNKVLRVQTSRCAAKFVRKNR